MNSILTEAFYELYEKESHYIMAIKYSAKFNHYNANVKLFNNNLTFSLSKEWKTVDKEIKKGLIQELMLKILKNKITPKTKKTLSMEIYNIFLKKVHIAAPKTKTHPILERSFDKINKEFFDDELEKTNLQFGQESFRKLGSYEYGSDTITISSILRDNQELIDYVMYHEMLHKKHKFTKNKTRSFHHTKAFRDDEKRYPDHELLEKKLSRFINKKRFLDWF